MNNIRIVDFSPEILEIAQVCELEWWEVMIEMLTIRQRQAVQNLIWMSWVYDWSDIVFWEYDEALLRVINDERWTLISLIQQ